MPELPEVEVLVRHLAPLLKGKTINRPARQKAGMSDAFIDRLEAWRPEP